MSEDRVKCWARELLELEDDVDEADPWDFLPRPKYSRRGTQRKSIVMRDELLYLCRTRNVSEDEKLTVCANVGLKLCITRLVTPLRGQSSKLISV